MPIDPSIALQVKPIELPNPIAQYAQMQQIQATQNQNRIADLMYGEKQQQISRTQNLRGLANNWSADTTDEQRRDSLRNNGYFDEADKLDTSLQNRTKITSDAEKAQADAHAKRIETAGKQLDLAGQAFGFVRQNPTAENAKAAISWLQQQGVYTPEHAAQDIAKVDANPGNVAQLADLAFRAALSAKDQLPKVDTRNLGGTTDTISIDPVTGAAKTVNSVKNTQSPDNAATNATTQRGQNMTDTRAREQLEAGRNQVVQSDNGPVLVNTRTGAGKTIMGPDGQPLPGVTKPLNDSQSKALLFGTRMQEADKALAQLAAEQVTTSNPGSRMGHGVGAVINALQGPNQQMLDQAKRDFMNAVLRRESGAAISTGEFDSADKQYFPQVGDSPAVIAQKASNRQLAINGVLAEVPEKQRASITPKAAATKAAPAANAKGWALHVDANGNKAYVSPDGKSFEEVK